MDSFGPCGNDVDISTCRRHIRFLLKYPHTQHMNGGPDTFHVSLWVSAWKISMFLYNCKKNKKSHNNVQLRLVSNPPISFSNWGLQGEVDLTSHRHHIKKQFVENQLDPISIYTWINHTSSARKKQMVDDLFFLASSIRSYTNVIFHVTIDIQLSLFSIRKF